MFEPLFRETQEGCGGLRGENPGAFPKAGPIFQQPFSLPQNAQTLAGIAWGIAKGVSIEGGEGSETFLERKWLLRRFPGAS